MSWRSLQRVLVAYLVALLVACLVLKSRVTLAEPASKVAVESWWKDGTRVARFVLVGGEATGQKRAVPEGAVAVVEDITGEASLSMHPLPFAFALVPGLDAVKVELDGKTAYATVDDLLSIQAYDHGGTMLDPSLGLGTHRASVLHILAQDLGVKPNEVAERGAFRRIRMKRREPEAPRITPTNIAAEREKVREAIAEAAHHLARGVDEYGRFRYQVFAPTNIAIPAYNWPRHAGATYFLAQAAALLDDAEIRWAALKAAARLRDTMTGCGPYHCVADDEYADVGSSALAVIALAEIVRTGADASYRRVIADLTSFLRAQQRPDGELMHIYNRSAQKPIDVQYLYYTGEAALALARAHRVTNDERDLDAAKRALHRLATNGWSFFGSRYYFSEEHWTCQAVADLWERAPDVEALEFCMRWHEFQRALQQQEGDSPFDGEGSFGVGPMITPRVTPAASRGEAAVALLDVLLLERVAGKLGHDDHVAPVDLELRRSLAFVMRHQLRPGPPHLFASPSAIQGSFPGSPVDWVIRIDYAQHAGSALVRWLEVSGRPSYPK